MSWTKTIAVESLAPGDRQTIKVENRSLLILNQGGNIYAVENICPHLKLSLTKAKLTEDGGLVCRWHRSEFELATGKVKTWCPWPPALGKLLGKVSAEKDLAVFPTRVEDGQIWVDLA